MMTKKSKNHIDTELDGLFAELRSEDTPLSEDLVAAILADAKAQQPLQSNVSARQQPAWWRGIADAIGGWQAAGALAACTAVGLWIGYAAPDSLADFSDFVFNTSSEEPFDAISTFDDLLVES